MVDIHRFDSRSGLKGEVCNMDFLLSILKNLPDAVSLGLVWGIMAIGVYITFKILDIADMTVDGSFALPEPLRGFCIQSLKYRRFWQVS